MLLHSCSSLRSPACVLVGRPVLTLSFNESRETSPLGVQSVTESDVSDGRSEAVAPVYGQTGGAWLHVLI